MTDGDFGIGPTLEAGGGAKAPPRQSHLRDDGDYGCCGEAAAVVAAVAMQA